MTEAVVVGGGLAGSAAALALRDRGVAVSVVDAERPGACATGASAGMLAPQYESAGPGARFRLLLRARAAFHDFARRVEEATGIDVGLRRDGMLVANLTGREHEASGRAARWQEEEGARAEVLPVDEALRLQPGVGRGALSYLWLPDEGQVDSQALAGALAEALSRAGVRVISGRRVAEVCLRGDAVEGVRLEDGRAIGAELVVVAAGAWSGRLRGLPRPLPLRPVRGHLLRYPPGAVALAPIVAGHAGRYLVPRGDGSILAGSTMDEVGFDRSVDDAGLAAIRDAAAQLVPALAALRPMEWWADLRPVTQDGEPILGPDPEVAGLHYATGFGRNGILLSPLAGEMVAAGALGEAVHQTRS